MAWDPDHIDFISEYCDRWCDRCSLTHKCAAFTRKDDPEEIDTCSEAIERAMEKLRVELAMPEPPPRAGLEEVLHAPTPGEGEQQEIDREYEEQEHRVRANPVLVAPHDYAIDAYTWLKLYAEATCARAQGALAPIR
mgnify:FL=1